MSYKQTMYNPIATYRIQFNKDFTFTNLDTLIPYLQGLGVTTLYASPIFAATPGSTHGYDGVDPNRINPEIGTLEALRAIRQRFEKANMGWLQDIVPNHMGYHINNTWLDDVLEKGPLSRYATFFDTALASSFFHGRLMAPFLAESLEDSIEKKELTLAYNQNRFVLEISGNVLPVKPESYATILQAGKEASESISQLLTELDQIRRIEDADTLAIEWKEFLLQLTSLAATAPIDSYLKTCLDAINGNPVTLQQIAEVQHYRLCSEPETRRAISYRRFFAVNTLICLNMGDEPVFQAVHSLTRDLVAEGVFQGLRVDHIDGLFDPAQYMNRLRELAGQDTYLVVEKILQGNEALPTAWPVQGTSGYDFLALVNNVLTNTDSEPAFRTFYHELIGSDTQLKTRIQYRKAYFLSQFMGGEVDNLYHYFLALDLLDGVEPDAVAAGELKLAIGELLVACPVYRYYANQLPLPNAEAQSIRAMLNGIRERKPDLTTAVGLLETALLTKPPVADKQYNGRAIRFYQRLMQFSGPLMAKGVEDTLLYTYNCFVGHNEVGDSPERFGMSADEFHQAMRERQRLWPLAQNTTATHDTKRGEDVRARLNVLTDLPDEWLAEVQQWQAQNKDIKESDSSERQVPDLNDEYFIYQNLLGAYPMPGQDEDDFPNRFQQYMEKAMQEAKRHTTGWIVEDDYQEGVLKFTKELLDPNRAFWKRFLAFHHKIAHAGVVNSLVQTLLKFTCPGVPDVYQGGEGWDLSLVDPDNRRPVDFATRQQWLTEFQARQHSGEAKREIWADLWQHRFDGRIKFWLTQALFHERSQHPNVFAEGNYIPLKSEGTYQQHVLAFARQHQQRWYVVVVPLHVARLCQEQEEDIMTLDWKDTVVVLPEMAPRTWTSCLTKTTASVDRVMSVQSLLAGLPVALLRAGL